jgi:hypothetical protein
MQLYEAMLLILTSCLLTFGLTEAKNTLLIIGKFFYFWIIEI